MQERSIEMKQHEYSSFILQATVSGSMQQIFAFSLVVSGLKCRRAISLKFMALDGTSSIKRNSSTTSPVRLNFQLKATNDWAKNICAYFFNVLYVIWKSSYHSIEVFWFNMHVMFNETNALLLLLVFKTLIDAKINRMKWLSERWWPRDFTGTMLI